jgi:hypothetical protein
MTYKKLKPPNLVEATGQGYRGIHTLYKLSEPWKFRELTGITHNEHGNPMLDYAENSTLYALVSTSELLGEDSTVIFPCNKDGVILDFTQDTEEIGTINHDHMMHIYFGEDGEI